MFRVSREDPQLGPDLAPLIDDLQGAATENRPRFLRDCEPRSDQLVRQMVLVPGESCPPESGEALGSEDSREVLFDLVRVSE